MREPKFFQSSVLREIAVGLKENEVCEAGELYLMLAKYIMIFPNVLLDEGFLPSACRLATKEEKPKTFRYLVESILGNDLVISHLGAFK
ncbi:hypothetical protein A3850_009735 [Lewinella sp. 4G2]|nr:hypothetical protein A3850_009735 [Lewinella sp. 4G2]